MMHCVANGHQIVALANLRPPISGKDELDSFMYQTVGHDAIDQFSACMDLPLFRREISGSSVAIAADYVVTSNDEVEDLLALLSDVKAAIPDVQAVSVGAILSNYQRVRVENVCVRLGLTCLAYLWRRDQSELLQEMIDCQLHAVLIKVASIGLNSTHLGKSLSEMHDTLEDISRKYGCNVCGEGGEYESLTLDCPIFKRRLVLDEVETVIHTKGAFATVSYLRTNKSHTEVKPESSFTDASWKTMILANAALPDIDSLLPSAQSIVAENIDLRVEGFDSQAVGQLREPTVCFAKPFLTIAGLGSGDCSLNESVENAVRGAMRKLEGILTKRNTNWSDVYLMHVYVKSIENFAAVNSIYGLFVKMNPPARVTVQLDQSEDVRIDCFAYIDEKPQSGRLAMHVQGISYWAPYSQTVKVEDQIYVSGQIGLLPHLMTMPIVVGADRIPPSELELRQFLLEAHQSLKSLAAVVDAQGCSIRSDCAICYCFVSSKALILPATDLWKKTNNRVPIVTVVVPQMPRDAKVEWQVIMQDKSYQEANTDESESDSDNYTTEVKMSSPWQSSESTLKTGGVELLINEERWARGLLSIGIIKFSAIGSQLVVQPPLLKSIVTNVLRVISNWATPGVKKGTKRKVLFLRVFVLNPLPVNFLSKVLDDEISKVFPHAEDGPAVSVIGTDGIDGQGTLVAVSAHLVLSYCSK
ncbi:ATP binding domain 4 [Blyttiomyces sp. JEL0837]|nr:ATP binding domain 4 [Blyttiomyces sp. JEL0837]